MARLYAATRAVLTEAIETLRARVGDAIDVEVRDFLAVHGKAGQPCPACGSAISEVKWARRAITSPRRIVYKQRSYRLLTPVSITTALPMPGPLLQSDRVRDIIQAGGESRWQKKR